MAREDLSKLRRRIRLARGDDASQLAKIRQASLIATVRGPRDEELDFLDRLALPHGEDYFCVLAEEEDQIAGYLIAGGSRDLDRKAHAEIYEIAVDPGSRRRGVATALLNEALERFDTAAFAGTLLRAPINDEATRRLAARAGMLPDGCDVGSSTVRYERALRRPVTNRSDS